MKLHEFLLFVSCIVLNVARSNLQETSFRDFEMPLSGYSESNTANANCSNISNFLPSNFVLKCNFVTKKITRDDYYHVPGIGLYKLHTKAKTWNEARKICNEEGAHLAIINSNTEAKVLTDLFGRAGPIEGGINQNEGLLGIHDLYAEGEWVSIQGDSLEKTGYSAWTDKWGGQPDNAGGIQNCGVLVVEDGKLDDVACNIPLAFFCEIPL